MSCIRSHKNKRSQLSVRLTRTYALLFAATTCCLSLCVYLVSRHFLIGRQQSDLLDNMANIAEIYYEEVAEGGDPADPELLWELSTDENTVLLVLAPDGTPLSQAGYYGILPPEIPRCENTAAFYTQSDGLALLAYGRAIVMDGRVAGSLVAVRRMDRECEFLRMLAWLLIGLNLVGAALALAAGRYTASKMLLPLSDMIHKARAIDAGALDTRLETPEADDELRLLALTVNDMLDRVQVAFLRQGQFTADASHELRSPLAVLQGNAELLARWGKDDPTVRDKCIAAIQRQVTHMNRLVNSLLFLTRGDHGAQALRPESIDLPVFLGEIIQERREIDPEHAYTLQAESLPPLCADATLLRQLVCILLDNAAKYTPRDGEIRLTAAACAGKTIITLLDEGCGVPPEQLGRIFERFYRVDKARARQTGGNGLGLAIAKTIVQLHNGTISASNRPGGGLAVTATFPHTD